MKNPAVDEFLENAKKWQQELTLLRSIVLDCTLTEELKWKQRKLFHQLFQGGTFAGPRKITCITW
jgi:uncharacterized protein YdeI (YjbR/CyaY-like superfamily)